MQTVVEMPSFRNAAKAAGMTEEEIGELISFLAENPDAGDVIEGTGGCRKLRVAGRGKGKSGGYRVITFFSGPSLPIFLLYAYAKGRKDDISKEQRNALADQTKTLAASYAPKIVGRRR